MVPKIIAGVLTAVCALGAHAEMHKCVDKDGKVTYQQRPCEGAVVVPAPASSKGAPGVSSTPPAGATATPMVAPAKSATNRDAASPPAARAADAVPVSAEIKGYLPPTSFAAEYVVIEPDPGFEAYGKRIQAAMAANKEWLAEYRKQYAGKDMPWHPNLGVTEADYQHYRQPMNQFREVSRKPIRVEKTTSGNTLTLKFRGDNLLLTDVEIDLATPAAKTPKGPLAFRSIVKGLEKASLPPGAHEGILFNTPDASIQRDKFRESFLVGKLTGTRTGIIHYEWNSQGKADRAYMTYPLAN